MIFTIGNFIIDIKNKTMVERGKRGGRPKTNQCSICHLLFKSKRGLAIHRFKTHHVKSPKFQYNQNYNLRRKALKMMEAIEQ